MKMNHCTYLLNLNMMNTEKRKKRERKREEKVQIVRYSLQSQQVLDKNWQQKLIILYFSRCPTNNVQDPEGGITINFHKQYIKRQNLTLKFRKLIMVVNLCLTLLKWTTFQNLCFMHCVQCQYTQIPRTCYLLPQYYVCPVCYDTILCRMVPVWKQCYKIIVMVQQSDHQILL